MYKFIKAAVIILSISPIISSQSIGVCLGHSFMNMNMINDVLERNESFFYDEGLSPEAPEEITGGFFFEGNFKYGVGIFNFGIEGNYLASSGRFYYGDDIGSFEEIFDVSSVEFLGLIELVFPSENTIVQPFIQAAGGIGIASVGYSGSLTSNYDPGYNYNLDGNQSGNYFASRFKSSLMFVFETLILEAAIGYRISNAGILMGDFVQNRIEYKNMPLRNQDGRSMEYNFSGVLITGGISFRF